MTSVLAIDPGPSESAYVVYTGRLYVFGKLENEQLIEIIGGGGCGAEHMAIEMIASYGMPVGREVFETCVWIGRFVQAWEREHTLVYRQQVKLHLCKSNKANDASIRQALIDKFGPGKDKAIGKKATPGPLYGVGGDVWSALAVAVTHVETSSLAVAA